jgi:hypothetical protein
MTSIGHAQLDGLYEFDGGGDGTSWDDATNWEQITDLFGSPLSGDPATPPDAVTSADITRGGVVIDITMPGQSALDLNIGTQNGAGSLILSGGDLTLRDAFVGRDSVSGFNAGTLEVTGGTLFVGDDVTLGAGSAGHMIMSNGMVTTDDDFLVNGGASLIMTGGVIDIGDRLVGSENANILLEDGTITVRDDVFLLGDTQMTVDGGLMQVVDKLHFDLVDPIASGKLTINGGIVRNDEYGNAGAGRGLIEINGDGVFQVVQSQLSIAEAVMLIAAGSTSPPASWPP